eukprot:TRINITY_DN1364_c0_g2_i2.p1 TRINITY_DN1364_c0_g2~~TRINITY_DN1364_c0_g2_i2.p1  ORF type:complete len:113 (-),score=3.45 TRINITY_DN1364_c0_g2_i2:140-478(-)
MLLISGRDTFVLHINETSDVGSLLRAIQSTTGISPVGTAAMLSLTPFKEHCKLRCNSKVIDTSDDETKLENLGLTDDSVIIITSHMKGGCGEGCGCHLCGLHCSESLSCEVM